MMLTVQTVARFRSPMGTISREVECKRTEEDEIDEEVGDEDEDFDYEDDDEEE